MRLNDLDKKNVAARALKENFAMDFNISGLDKSKTLSMLKKVTGLIKESRQSPGFQKSETSPAYMKLLFMEQALKQHLPNAKAPRIIYENEEVEKSQVILAAQDMIDTVQKMYEDINDMLVKELPALVDSIQSEIGVNESTQFNDAASQSLTALNSALQETQTALKGALGGLTGQGAVDAFAAGDELGADMDADLEAGDELGADMGADLDAAPEPDTGAELPPLPDMGDEEPQTGSVGREKR